MKFMQTQPMSRPDNLFKRFFTRFRYCKNCQASIWSADGDFLASVGFSQPLSSKPDKLNSVLSLHYIILILKGSEGASIEHIMASELYPKKPMVSDVEGLTVPYPPLCGESVMYLGRTAEGTIALSNFRIFIRYSSSIANVPLGLIDTIESRDIFFLYIYCKDARMFR